MPRIPEDLLFVFDVDGTEVRVGPGGDIGIEELEILKTTIKRMNALGFRVDLPLGADFVRAILAVKGVLGGRIVDPVEDIAPKRKPRAEADRWAPTRRRKRRSS